MNVKWDVDAYVNGERIAKNLLDLALKQNRMLDDVKKELKEHFPTVEFRVTGGRKKGK